MNGWLEPAAVLITAGGVVSAVAAYRMAGSVGSAVAVLVDFLVAAGLIRLAADLSWDGIWVTAAVIALRKLISAGLAAPRRGGGVPMRGAPGSEGRR
ncbi:DUF1622 domain-containing protein [Streptomyces pimonensis]|uniref:DUF1622 domain-containing protein n=1 Tax=Streptomyces pimonensis TaxID=2860288 RepID=A0ABV4JBJ3_9ACTN